MITITDRPLRTISALTSRWTAGHNPVVYKFERTDYNITDITPTGLYGGSHLIRVPAIGLGMVVGGSVSVSSTKYRGVGVIAEVQEAGGVTSLWVTGLVGTQSDVGGKLNDLSRRNYRIEINIKESGSNKLLGTAELAPFSNGIGKIDLQTYLAPYLLLKNEFGYDVVNERDIYGSLKFYITYQERWRDNDGAVTSDVAQPIFVTNSAKQIGDLYGQNMAQYLISNISAAKFLTKFKVPVFWEGYPFSVSFIHSELLPFELTKNEALLDVNKQQIDTQDEALDTEQKESVNRLMLAEGYGDNVSYVRLKLRTGNPIPSNYVYPGYVAEGYTAKV